MLSVIRLARKLLGRLLLVVAGALLAACVPAGGPSGPGAGQGGSVQVALLIPSGSGQAQDDLFGQNLENAARLAMADLSGVKIDLRVYRTAGNPDVAASLAQQAVAEGAQVILGPFYSQEANAAGAAVAASGVNVLAFSNNADIAGGNVFVLGQTFDNTARRLASYAVRSGKGKILIVHDRNVAGDVGRTAIERGIAAAGGSVAGVASYEFSQNGIVQAATGIVATARSSGANALFLTADTAGALPLLSQLLVDNGIDRTTTQFIGLTRWDIPPSTLALPGLQGGWFALPDPGLQAQFQARYEAAYGTPPSVVAGLAYDGIAAIGALARSSGGAPIT
ncbi:MAG: penicillin-binding protein activator, partial [Rhodobacterales bacterium 12-65-15]